MRHNIWGTRNEIYNKLYKLWNNIFPINDIKYLICEYVEFFNIQSFDINKCFRIPKRKIDDQQVHKIPFDFDPNFDDDIGDFPFNIDKIYYMSSMFPFYDDFQHRSWSMIYSIKLLDKQVKYIKFTSIINDDICSQTDFSKLSNDDIDKVKFEISLSLEDVYEYLLCTLEKEKFNNFQHFDRFTFQPKYQSDPDGFFSFINKFNKVLKFLLFMNE